MEDKVRGDFLKNHRMTREKTESEKHGLDHRTRRDLKQCRDGEERPQRKSCQVSRSLLKRRVLKTTISTDEG